MTACAHIITAVIGSGVLSLAWAIAQLGWIAGVTALILFSLITLYTSLLLTNFIDFLNQIEIEETALTCKPFRVTWV